jgi:hypothetical protein
MKRTLLPLSIVFLLLSAGLVLAGRAQTKPDFSGVWNLNLKESKLQIPPPDSGVFRIEHREPTFRLSRTFVRGGQEDVSTLDLTTDGKEVVQEEGAETFRGRLSWKGDDLFLDSTLTIGNRSGLNQVTYHLSGDGKVLTATEAFRGPRLKYDNVWVFNKG